MVSLLLYMQDMLSNTCRVVVTRWDGEEECVEDGELSSNDNEEKVEYNEATSIDEDDKDHNNAFLVND